MKTWKQDTNQSTVSKTLDTRAAVVYTRYNSSSRLNIRHESRNIRTVWILLWILLWMWILPNGPFVSGQSGTCYIFMYYMHRGIYLFRVPATSSVYFIRVTWFQYERKYLVLCFCFTQVCQRSFLLVRINRSLGALHGKVQAYMYTCSIA